MLVSNVLNKYTNRYVLFSLAVAFVVAGSYLRLRGTWLFFHGWRMDTFITVGLAFTLLSINKKMRVLTFVGTHATNIYLFHTFFYLHLFSRFFYSFKNPILIFLALLVVCLSLSVCIEFCKRKAGFYELENCLVNLVKNRRS